MRVIDECAPTQPWCEVLAAHLGLDGSGDKGRRFAVASKLARLFDRYGRSRPDMIVAWRDGRDEVGDGTALPTDLTWQAELWRRLRSEIGTPSPAELLDVACARIRTGAAFSIFGPTRISPARVRILKALAEHRDVHLWLHHPSPALWDAVTEAREPPGRRRDQHPAVQNPLLASMSRDVRELQQLLNDVPHGDEHHPIWQRPATLLGRLQDDLAHDRVREAKSALEASDTSVRVHAAHGPARQVEVVREVILGLLLSDPTLEPRDILIMCPDVETFAPLVAASFGMSRRTRRPSGSPAARQARRPGPCDRRTRSSTCCQGCSSSPRVGSRPPRCSISPAPARYAGDSVSMRTISSGCVIGPSPPAPAGGWTRTIAATTD